MGRTWRLGTRGSDLAVTQSQTVADALQALTGERVELVIIKTKGDAIRDRPLSQVGGKGVFTKEIEDAMLAHEVDLAVHSMKDMPTEDPPGLVIAGVPERADPHDALVGSTLAALPAGAVVGTGSARRAMQVQAARPDVEVRGIRGNVETRIRKMRDGDYDAVVLAAAGLARLGLLDQADEILTVKQMVPAVGQGALAVQCRADDAVLRGHLEALTHGETWVAVQAERAFLRELEGGCSVPAACHAVIDDGRLRLWSFFGRDDGAWVGESGIAEVEHPASAGRELARRLKERLARQPGRAADEGTAPRRTP